MNLNNKEWFVLTFNNMLKGYNMGELVSLYDSMQTYQRDFVGEACQAFYDAGYKACQEDAM